MDLHGIDMNMERMGLDSFNIPLLYRILFDCEKRVPLLPSQAVESACPSKARGEERSDGRVRTMSLLVFLCLVIRVYLSLLPETETYPLSSPLWGKSGTAFGDDALSTTGMSWKVNYSTRGIFL